MQLVLLEYVDNVLTDVLLGRLRQLRHLALRQPDGFPLHPHFKARAAVVGLVQNQFGLWLQARVGIRGHGLKRFKILQALRPGFQSRSWCIPCNNWLNAELLQILQQLPVLPGGSM